jgi:hypothetical protein
VLPLKFALFLPRLQKLYSGKTAGFSHSGRSISLICSSKPSALITSSGIMSDLNSLPDNVLEIMMHQVPVRDRLTSCCLVNSKLHAAAVAATDSLTLGQNAWLYPEFIISDPQRAQAALEWLASYSQQLWQMTSLEFQSFPQTLHQLPCPKLLDLTVQYSCSVQLGSSATPHPGVISGCTNLTKLELSCNIIDARGSAEVCGSLSSLVHLQHLHLMPRNEQFRYQAIDGLSSGTLPCLKHLTHLDVYNLSMENIYELSALTNLRQLGLETDPGVVVGPRTVPDMVFPASLTQLRLASPVEAAILSAVPAGLTDLGIYSVVQGPTEGPDSLLSGIARLSSLTRLHCFVQSDGSDLPPAGPAYSALTSSSNLVELAMYGNVLPEGVWPFVFPAARTLPHLTQFCASYEYGYADPALPGAWSAADVASLVKCCPNLCKIEEMTMQRGSHVSELNKLTALTDIDLHYGPGDQPAVEATMQGLSAVTRLQKLSLDLHCFVVSVTALLPLMRLTALDWLGFSCDLHQVNEDGEFQDDPDLEVSLHQVSRLTCSHYGSQHAAWAALAGKAGIASPIRESAIPAL